MSLVKGVRLRPSTPPFVTQDASSLSTLQPTVPFTSAHKGQQQSYSAEALSFTTMKHTLHFQNFCSYQAWDTHKAAYPNPNTALHTPPSPGQKPTPQAAQTIHSKAPWFAEDESANFKFNKYGKKKTKQKNKQQKPNKEFSLPFMGRDGFRLRKLWPGTVWGADIPLNWLGKGLWEDGSLRGMTGRYVQGEGDELLHPWGQHSSSWQQDPQSHIARMVIEDLQTLQTPQIKLFPGCSCWNPWPKAALFGSSIS